MLFRSVCHEDCKRPVIIAVNPIDREMRHPHLLCCHVAVVARKDVLARLLNDDGSEPPVLLNAGDDCTDITLSGVAWVRCQIPDGNVFNKR